MENFETYAERVISSLSEPDDTGPSQVKSPLEGVLSDIDGDIFDIADVVDVTQLQGTKKQIDPEEVHDIENGVLASGMEALAFYKSIRYKRRPPFKGKWGIFIYDHALAYLSQEISDFYPKKFTPNQCLSNAFRLLYFHERFHFRFDCWVISHESATGKPLYENYKNSVYRIYHPNELIYEETLANLHSLSSVSRYGIYEYARQFMLSQPGAYSNIIGIDRDEYRSRLAAQLFHGPGQFLGVPALMLPEHSQYLASPKNSKIIDRNCPLYVVKGVSPSRFVDPSISLPKVRDIEKGYLKKYLNGKEKRTDHKYFVIDNGQKIKCPNPHNKHLKLGEFYNIVKKSGLTKNEYFEEEARTKNWKKCVPRESTKPPLL